MDRQVEKQVQRAKRIVELLRQLNPYVKLDVKVFNPYNPESVYIYGNIPGDNLHLPKKVYYNTKWGFNNGISRSSLEYKHIYYKYDYMYFEPKPEVKKPFLARLFGK